MNPSEKTVSCIEALQEARQRPGSLWAAVEWQIDRNKRWFAIMYNAQDGHYCHVTGFEPGVFWQQFELSPEEILDRWVELEPATFWDEE